MSSIGVDFTLRANTAAFTQGLAKVSNATAELRKGLLKNFDGRDLARGLVTAFGLSIDKIADKFARLFTGMSKEAEENYKKLGDLTDDLTEKTIEAGRARLTEEQKYQLALQDTARLQRAIADNQGKTLEDQIRLTQDKIALLGKEKEAAEAKAKADKEAADKEAAEIERQKRIRESAEKATEQERKERKEFNREQEQNRDRADKALMDKFAPSVEQLAQMEVGGFSDPNDPRLVARRIIEKEKNAAILGNRGDIGGAIALGREARDMRESIQFSTGAGTALTQQTAETAFKSALDTTNTKLDGIEKALGGLIKAQD